jgi:hypothetical protein
MHTRSAYRLSFEAHAIALGFGVFGLVSNALAGCGLPGPFSEPRSLQDLKPAAAGLTPALYRPGTGGFVRVFDDGDRNAGIVGLWKVTLVSDGTAYPGPVPFGAVVDFGTQQWHSDGTELLVSGGRAPSTGDVCMGVWEPAGHGSYKLKHVALAYASSDTPTSQGGPVVPAAYVGPTIIREHVTLSASGKTFEGTFTIDAYAKDEVTLLEHIAGKVVGTRVTLD